MIAKGLKLIEELKTKMDENPKVEIDGNGVLVVGDYNGISLIIGFDGDDFINVVFSGETDFGTIDWENRVGWISNVDKFFEFLDTMIDPYELIN